MSLEISGPEKIKIGEKFDYTIKYRNLDEIRLRNTRIAIQFPHGFILDKAEPIAGENNEWSTGNLSFMKGGEIKITGKIVDAVDREQKIKALITFSPENFNSDFTKETSLSTALESPDIALSATIPANITASQKINIDLNVKNTTSVGFDDAKIIFTKPENFTVQTTKPTATKDTTEWQIARMDPFSDVTELKIEGSFPKDISFLQEEDRTQNFSFQLLLKGKEEQYYLVKETKFNTKIIDQALNTFLIINGSAGNQLFFLGDKLTYSVTAKNSGKQTFSDIGLKTIINATPIDIIDWNKINDENFGKIEKTTNGKEILWDKNQFNGLSNFGPGAEQVINFSLPTKTLENLKAENNNLDLSLLGKTLIDSYSEITFSNTDISPIKGSPIQAQLNTNLDIQTKALYYFDDGTPIGTGPIPPKANQKTKLNIFWTIANEIHEINEISVTTTIPNNINWTNSFQVSTGEITFDETTRKIIWKINRLPKNITEATANFGIEFTPTNEDIGKIIKLTNNTTVSAKDTVTNALITKTKNILTSILEEDKHAKGQGVVIP